MGGKGGGKGGSGAKNGAQAKTSKAKTTINMQDAGGHSAPLDKNDAGISQPSVIVAFVVYCLIPITFLAMASIYGRYFGDVDHSLPTSRGRDDNGGSVMIDTSKMPRTADVSEMLAKRGIKVNGVGPNSQNNAAAQQQKQQQRSEDSMKSRIDQYIDGLRKDHQADPTNIYKTLALAEGLRQRDLSIHDGGSAQVECIETYEAAIESIQGQRAELIQLGKPTNVPLSGESTSSINEELFLDTNSKSLDGLLCATYCGLGKISFMANQFDRAVKIYDQALELAQDYLDALTYRGSALIILGRYEEAARDYMKVLEIDEKRLFVDVYTGLGKILVAKEDAVEGGWEPLIKAIEKDLPVKESQLSSLLQSSSQDDQQISGMKTLVVDALKRMHLAMFSYHDTKTKDSEKAWSHLSAAYKHKMSILPPFNAQHEANRVAMVKQVFTRGFFPEGVGSDSQVPIFIIGFVRSGSTLLERVLDAHPEIVGTGEDSVFNGQLETIRNKIVEASMSQNPAVLQQAVRTLADSVVRDMTERWEMIHAQTSKEEDSEEHPQRFVDKMLTNYMNVGFIHMLFPNALILHVIREPMDSVFSAFKHDFPPGTLDYTSDFPSLSQLYLGYREIMEHWDQVLPGRVTHIRYEDIVEDLPGVAKALIDATSLSWSDDVLEFHKKKQAVNTLSTTQVRKGMYKDHFKSWKRYEDQLRPLSFLLGDKIDHSFRTTVPGYQANNLSKQSE